MQLRSVHRWTGIILAVWVLNAAVTGMLRANATALYWKDRPARGVETGIPVPELAWHDLYKTVGRITGQEEVLLRNLKLKMLQGEPVFQVEPDVSGAGPLLIHAQTGALLSPLTPERAAQIASAYVDASDSVRNIELLDAFLPRKAKHARPAYRVVFDDARETEVFIDRDTGEMVYLLDRGRRFGLWMIHLHELDFYGMRRPALTALGLGTVFLTVTGLLIAWVNRRNNAKRKRKK